MVGTIALLSMGAGRHEVAASQRASGLDPIPTADTSPIPLVPAVREFSVSRSRFQVGPRATPTSGRASAARGATFAYRLSEPATVEIVIQRLGARPPPCVRPTRCPVVPPAGVLTRISHTGRNRVPFSGRIGKKPLGTGSYRATAAARSPVGVRSTPPSVLFTILPG